ncbi:MAG: hypothetical protein ACI9LM_002080 [Alteromonadaceae bacterium]|jgi:hypothetical protein
MFILWFIPSYQSWRYEGADVSGAWNSDNTYDDGSRIKVSMQLTQHAHILEGSLFYEIESESKCISSNFLVKGDYWEGYFTITLKSINRKMFSNAALVMKLTDGGGAMIGQFTFRNVVRDEVGSEPLKLFRS